MGKILARPAGLQDSTMYQTDGETGFGRHLDVQREDLEYACSLFVPFLFFFFYSLLLMSLGDE